VILFSLAHAAWAKGLSTLIPRTFASEAGVLARGRRDVAHLLGAGAREGQGEEEQQRLLGAELVAQLDVLQAFRRGSL
jgi:hypothetical protein